MKSMLKSLMSVAAAALALTSCSTDATEEVLLKSEPRTLEVNASIDQTRTAMAANHIDLEWSEGDEIYLYIGADTTKADVIKHTIGDKITNVTYNEGDMVYANYSLNNSYSNGAKAAEINIKNAQNQTEANVFAGENLPMVATGIIKDGKVDLTFKPVGCVLVFNVYGPAENEKIKSIKFETSVGCCGYDYCDLTAETLVYEPYKNNTSAAVTLGTPAAIGSSKPNDTQIGENQVYLVVAPVNYPAGSKFVVTTDAGETYTFETSSAIDCTTKTARVVNLNLAKAPEMKPAIEVPAVPQQESAAGDLQIEGIVFKHFAASEVEKAEAGVYSDAELTQPLDNDAWLTISNDAILASGSLNCRLAANETAEDRTAYIGIKCGGVQVAIAITQVAQGGSTDKYYVKVTEDLGDWTGEYLIVYEGENETLALNGSLTKDAANNNIKVEVTAQGILSNDTTNAALVKISKKEGSADEYMLQAASNFYIYSSNNSKNTLDYNMDVSKAASNLISINADGSANIKSCVTNKVLRFNSAKDQMRFRYYKSGQQPVQLYKLQ